MTIDLLLNSTPCCKCGGLAMPRLRGWIAGDSQAIAAERVYCESCRQADSDDGILGRRAGTLFASQTLRWLEAGVTPSDLDIESAWNLAVERARAEDAHR